MKPSWITRARHPLLVMALLASPMAQAGSDREICQGGYSQLLMTAGECRVYLDELRAAETRGDYAAVLEWQAWHDELLIERAAACPCQARQAEPRLVRPAAARVAASGQH